MLREGQKVKIINAEKIDCNDGYFKNGDVTEITKYKGHLALKHSAKELKGGLVLSSSEEQFVKLI